MTSLKADKFKGELNQQLYDNYISLIDVHSLMCTCGSHDNVIHGYYKRKDMIYSHRANANSYKAISCKITQV